MPSLEELLRPIPGDNPSGQYLRFKPVYSQIKEARRADEPGNRGDWERAQKTASFTEVETLAIEALTNQSKDLQIAAWLTEAWTNLRGLNGLTDGLNLMRMLLETFWETLFPEIDEGDLEMRGAPLKWVAATLAIPVKYIPMTRSGLNYVKYEESRQVGYQQDATTDKKKDERSTAIDSKMVTAEAFDEAKDATSAEFYERVIERLRPTREALEALHVVCREKFGQDALPNLLPIRKTLEAVTETAGMFIRQKRPAAMEIPGQGFVEQLDDPDETASVAPLANRITANSDVAPVPILQASTQSASPPSLKPEGQFLEPESREDAIARIIQAANYLRNHEPGSVVPYLVLRGLRWGELREGGDPPDLLSFSPPSTGTRQRLKTLARESEWSDLLQETELAMSQPCGCAWLDLQRYAEQSCHELGSSFEYLAKAIRSETRALLMDFPELPRMMLADDTPVANSDTRTWLDKLIKKSEQVPVSGRLMEQDGSTGAQVQNIDAYEMALEAAQSGQHESAIELLAREVVQERSGRARFQRKIQLAQICMAAGCESVAQPILLSIAQEIEVRKLEEWEPREVLSHPLTLLLRCLTKLKSGPEEKQEIYARICCLDPVQAMEFAK
jgi:type VI secretion system protein ImpA